MRAIIVIILTAIGVWGGGSFFPRQALAAPVSMSAGRAGEHVVTTREVMINHWIESALFRYKSGRLVPQSVIRLDQPKDRAFVRETTAVILENAIFFEAESFGATPLSDAEVDKKMRLVETRLKKQTGWRNLDVESKELRWILTRKLRAKEFIKFKIDSATIPISDREALEYFNNNRMKFENLPFESFKENIKGYLTQQRVDRRLKDWFELLQSKYRVRNFLAE